MRKVQREDITREVLEPAVLIYNFKSFKDKVILLSCKVKGLKTLKGSTDVEELNHFHRSTFKPTFVFIIIMSY